MIARHQILGQRTVVFDTHFLQRFEEAILIVGDVFVDGDVRRVTRLEGTAVFLEIDQFREMVEFVEYLV